ncbi:MAG: hypothetical protein IAF38_11990 [Bacteroidia bacterium]|nr:hypothetical protein [Bacteroidia bacterium]
MNNTYKNYLEDTLLELIERTEEAQCESDKGDFESGRAFAYLEIISFLFKQADVFDIKSEFENSRMRN